MNKTIIIFCVFLFYNEVRFQLAFNILSSYSNSNFSIRRFSHEQFLITKYSSILHALLHSQPHILRFHI